MKIKASDLKATRFKPEDYQWAKLEDGSIEPLYYQDGKGGLDLYEARNFYYNQFEDEGEVGWFLDHDVWFGNGVAYCHSKIVEFATTKEELEK